MAPALNPDEDDLPSNDLADYLSVIEAADALGCGESWIRYLVGHWRRGIPKSGVPPRIKGLPSYRLSDILGVPPLALARGVRTKWMIYRRDLEEYRREGRVTRPSRLETVSQAS